MSGEALELHAICKGFGRHTALHEVKGRRLSYTHTQSKP